MMSDMTTDTAGRVTITRTGVVADVRLNRPEKRNALDPAMFEALVAAGERLKCEPGLRAVVLSGTGPDFCAEQEEIRALIGSPNQVEAVTARLEKRDPSFGEA
jgi:1,4-dihydroxy-2-naphthoyl-CoA synthase